MITEDVQFIAGGASHSPQDLFSFWVAANIMLSASLPKCW